MTSRAADARRSATAATVLAAALAAGAIFVPAALALRRDYDLAWIDPLLVRALGLRDSVPRNLLFRLGLLAVGGLLLALDAFHARWRRWTAAQDPEETGAALLAAVAIWTLAAVLDGGLRPLPWLAALAGILAVLRGLGRREASARALAAEALLVLIAAAGLLCAWLDAARDLRSDGAPKALLHLLVCAALLALPAIERAAGLARGPTRARAAALAACLLPALAWAAVDPAVYRFPLDMSRFPPNILAFYEEHLHTFVLRPALQLTQSRPDLASVRPAYGLAYPAAMAALHRLAGRPVDIATYLRLAAPLNLVLVVCALLGFYFYGGRRLLPALAVAPLVLSWNTAAAPALEPNQGAARFIGVPAFFLLLWAARRRNLGALTALAAPALGLCFTINPETSLALLAAFLVFVWFRRRDEPWGVKAADACAAGAAAVVAAAAVWLSVASLAAPGGGLAGALLRQKATISLFAAGFGGLDFAGSPAPFLVGLLALAVWADVAAREAAPSPKNAFRAAVAAFIVVWGAYYVNRPGPTDLKAHLFAFGFLAMDLLRLHAARARRIRRAQPPSPSALVPTAVVALVLVAGAAPLVTDAAFDAGRDLLWMASRPASVFHPGRGPLASGVLIPAELAAQMEDAHAVWSRYARPEDPCLVLSAHPIFLSAATCYPRLPVADAFAAVTDADYRALLDAIRSSGARELFVAADAALPDAGRRRFYARLRADLSAGFRLRARAAALEVWERRPVSAAPVRPSRY